MAARINPMTIGRIDQTPQGRVLQLRSFAPGRSFRPLEVAHSVDPALFAELTGWLEGGAEPGLPDNALTTAQWLSTGLLLAAEEASAIAPSARPSMGDGMDIACMLMPGLQPLADAKAALDLTALDAMQGSQSPLKVNLPPLLSDKNLTLVQNWYRLLHEGGWSGFEKEQGSRRGIHGDPVGRRILHDLTGPICALFGQNLKPSYAYAVQYHGGNALPPHTDREQCEITVSLLIEHVDAKGHPARPWPIILDPEGPDETEVTRPEGGGIAFRGREVRHARPPLQAGERARFLFVHYVDAAFEGRLD